MIYEQRIESDADAGFTIQQLPKQQLHNLNHPPAQVLTPGEMSKTVKLAKTRLR